jgi:hypothetical protein
MGRPYLVDGQKRLYAFSPSQGKLNEETRFLTGPVSAARMEALHRALDNSVDFLRHVASERNLVQSPEYSERAEIQRKPVQLSESIEIDPDRNYSSDERKMFLRQYKAECKVHGVKMTNPIIGNTAKPTWNNRTPVEKWSHGKDPRYNTPDVNRRILSVLKNKPHIPK